MGYRSDVSTAIWGTEEELNSFLTHETLIVSDGLVTRALEEFKDSVKRRSFVLLEYDNDAQPVRKTMHGIFMTAENVKWYADDKDVELWNQFMSRAGEAGLNTEFIRTGEDDNDTEHEVSSEYSLFYFTLPQIKEDLDVLEENMPVL